jgi:GDPmannose 4,6-dehydratase
MTENPTPKKALITGVTGQDGAYLSRLLLAKGYEVHGITRRASGNNLQRIGNLTSDDPNTHTNFFSHFGDLTDSANIVSLVQEIKPDEIYNLGAQSHVQVSFSTPAQSADADALGALRLLEAIHICGLDHKTRYYQASTSDLFGLAKQSPQKETTPFYPRSPYAAAKLYAYWITTNYREAYDIYATNGILYNHESPLRGETFVTRKITRAAARISLGMQQTLYLGNLDSTRDWGFAGDYVELMWLMLQQDKPEDFIIATGISTTVRDFAKTAFAHVDIPLEFTGEGVHERGVNANTGATILKVDPSFFRPAEVSRLVGDASKARELLGWEPKVSLNELIAMMVEADLIQARRDLCLIEHGFERG